VHLNTRASRFE